MKKEKLIEGIYYTTGKSNRVAHHFVFLGMMYAVVLENPLSFEPVQPSANPNMLEQQVQTMIEEGDKIREMVSEGKMLRIMTLPDNVKNLQDAIARKDFSKIIKYSNELLRLAR